MKKCLKHIYFQKEKKRSSITYKDGLNHSKNKTLKRKKETTLLSGGGLSRRELNPGLERDKLAYWTTILRKMEGATVGSCRSVGVLMEGVLF